MQWVLKELALADLKADVLLSRFDLLIYQTSKVLRSRDLQYLTLDVIVEFIVHKQACLSKWFWYG